jgi:hypothetical protein
MITQPKDGELFSSWLFRLAVKNVTKVHTFCRFHLPGQNIWNRDIDRLVSITTIERLSLLTEIPFQTIYQLTIRSYEKEVFENCITNTKQKWVLPLGVYHRTWKNYGLQYCPVCLSKDEEPYFRKSWRLGLSVACTKCHTLLHDRCPNCNTPITFFRTDVGFKTSIAQKEITICSHCDFDLRNSPRHPPVIGTIGFQTKINNVLRKKTWREHYPSYEYFDALYQILKMVRSESRSFRSFTSLIASFEDLRISKLNSERDFEKICTIDREHLLRISSWILEGWPHRFVQLCKTTRLTTSIALKDGVSLPRWFIAEAAQHLHLPSASEKSMIRARHKPHP